MKLPGIDYGGRAESLDAGSKLRTARNWSHAFEALGDTAMRFADAQNEEAFMNERNEYLLEKSKLDLQLRNPYQETKNIPTGVAYEPTEEKWVNGQKTTSQRAQIPTYEVQTPWMDNFHAQADAKAKERLSGGAYKKWQSWFAEQSLADRTRNGIAQMDAAQAASKARVGETIESLTDSGKYEDAALTLAQSPYHTEAEKIKAADKIANEAEMRPIEDAAMRGDLATLQQQKERLLDENYIGVLDADVRRRTVKYIDGEMNRAEAEANAALAEANARFYSDANLEVDNRKAGPLQIEQWYAEGRIKPNQRTALHRRYQVMLNQETTEANYDQFNAGVMNEEIYASPANKDHKKAINQFAEKGPEQAVAISIKSGILADNLRDAFASSAINAPADKAAELVPLWTTMEDTKPSLFSGMHGDTDDIYTLAAQLYRGGLSEKQAMENARQNYDMPEEKRKFYEGRYKMEVKDSDNISALRKEMEDDELFSGGWFSRDMDYAIPQLQYDYETAVKNLYVLSGGNLPLAQKAAFNKVKRSYGTTGVGGGYEIETEGEFGGDWEEELKRPMKYPVEKMTGLPTDQAQEVFRTYALDRGYDSERLYYIDDNITARSADNPSYQVIYHDKDTGDFYPLRRPDNTLDRWKPLEWLDSTIERKRETELNRARIAREKVVENREENEQARSTSDMFDERIMTGPEERQRMQRKFFGD